MKKWTLFLISITENKFINLTRRQHKFLCLERATIAEWQGASEDQKFVAKPTQSNMKLFFVIGISIFIFSCSQKSLSKDPVSFHKGYTLWKNAVECSQFPYDVDEVIEGIKAASLKKDLPIKEEEIVAILDQFEQKQIAQNLADAEKMLQTLSSGCVEVVPNKLYYKLLRSGEKSSPLTSNSLADFTYRISILENGIFNEIFSTGNTAVRVNMEDTIPGFALGIVGMQTGEKRVIYMHPELTSGSYPEFLNKLIIIEVERQ